VENSAVSPREYGEKIRIGHTQKSYLRNCRLFSKNTNSHAVSVAALQRLKHDQRCYHIRLLNELQTSNTLNYHQSYVAAALKSSCSRILDLTQYSKLYLSKTKYIEQNKYLPERELEWLGLTKQARSTELREFARAVVQLFSRCNCNYQKKSS
jgi:hypothetical protein